MGAEALTLGPTTERRFAEAFANGATITLAAAADLLDVDEKTLKALTEAGVVACCPRGPKRVGYSEVALRSYLLSPPSAAPARPEKTTCQSTSRRTAPTSTTISSTKVVGFMEARASRRAAMRRRSNAG